MLRHDQDKLGWMVLDLRMAKMNAARAGYLTGDGEWTPVMGAGTSAAQKVRVTQLVPERRHHTNRRIPSWLSGVVSGDREIAFPDQKPGAEASKY